MSAPRAAVQSRGSFRAHGNFSQRHGVTTRAHVRTQSRSHVRAAESRRSHARQAKQDRRERVTYQRERARDVRQNRREAVQARGLNNREAARARINAREARAGRFGSPFYRNAARYRVAYRPYNWAWRNGWYAGFTPWFGPVFWPYAYADIFAYTFWPYGYAPGYWAYAYDDFVDGVFWGYGGPPAGYAYAPESASRRTARARTTTTAPTNVAAAQELCKQPGTGVTAWPFDDIAQKVNLSDDQKKLLDDMKTASADAAERFSESCPPDSNFAATPPGRLDSMTARLFATLQAVETVRPPLEKFYASLSDEQKERFNQLGPNEAKMAAVSGKKQAAETQGAAARDEQANANCGEPKPGLANLPIDRIEQSVKPTEAQEASLKDLETATNNAVGILQAACPGDVPATPPGRLEAMDKRLKAMIEAANTIKPELDKFYTGLTDEQKARFNKLGRQIMASNE